MRLAMLTIVLGLAVACAVPNVLRGAEGGDVEERMDNLRAQVAAMVDGHCRDVIAAMPEGEPRFDAMLIVGAFYEMGMLGDADPIQAARYYLMAGEKGVAEANCALGNIYANGVEGQFEAIDRDVGLALHYYEQAAVGGSIKAMMALADYYSDGRDGVAPDSKKALAHLMDAASRGDENALSRLDPVLRKAKEWEEQRPGRKSNFPTSRDAVIKPHLVQAEKERNFKLERIATTLHRELNRRIAQSGRAGVQAPR